jgi:hypothetical protein
MYDAPPAASANDNAASAPKADGGGDGDAALTGARRDHDNDLGMKRQMDGLPKGYFDKQDERDYDAQQRNKEVQAKVDAEPDPYKKAAIRVENGADTTNEPPKPDDKPLDMSTPKAREDVLDKMVQNNPDDKESKDRCGPTSVLAGAIKAGGMEGVKAVLGDVATGPDGKPDPEVADLQAKLKTGEVSAQDLQAIEAKMYAKMREGRSDADKAQAGVSPDEIKNFMAKDQALSKMYKDNHLEIDAEDVTGSGRASHAVLAQRDANNNLAEIYDPYQRKDGHQVITDPTTLHDYDNARKRAIPPPVQS